MRGLRTRAGVEVDLTWSAGVPVRVRLRHLRAGSARVTWNGTLLGRSTGTTGDEYDVPVPVHDDPGATPG